LLADVAEKSLLCIRERYCRRRAGGLRGFSRVGPLHRIVLDVCLTAACLFGAENDTLLSTLRRHFEWGEYDRIIQLAEPALDGLGRSADSAFLSQAHKYLGVAYFAKGRVGEAQEQFARSLEYNAEADLDRDFVSAAMYDLFLKTAKEARKEQARRDSVLEAQVRQLRYAQVVKASVDSLGRLRRRPLAGALTTGAAGLVLAGIAAWQYTVAGLHYSDFLSAAEQGRLQEYRDQQALVERGDLATVVAGVFSAVAAAGATVFFSRVAAKTRQIRRLSASGSRAAGLTIAPGGNLAVEF
jgi:tetratricopeptide (TPR) repeat protein